MVELLKEHVGKVGFIVGDTVRSDYRNRRAVLTDIDCRSIYFIGEENKTRYISSQHGFRPEVVMNRNGANLEN